MRTTGILAPAGQTVLLRRRRCTTISACGGAMIGAIVIVLLVWIVPKMSLKAALPSPAPNIALWRQQSRRLRPYQPFQPRPHKLPFSWHGKRSQSADRSFRVDTITAIVVDTQTLTSLHRNAERGHIPNQSMEGFPGRPHKAGSPMRRYSLADPSHRMRHIHCTHRRVFCNT